MDRVIKKKKFNPGRIALIISALTVIFFLIYHVLSRSGTTRYKADTSRMTFSKVEYGVFQEYYPFDGTVVPITSYLIDLETGGRVEEIFTEGGEDINKGDLILRLSNANLQRNSIETETRLIENLNELGNTQFNRAQSKLMLKDTLLDLNYQILDLENIFKRYEVLKKESIAISQEKYEKVRDELQYKKDKRDLLKERIRQEDLLNDTQLEQATNSIKRINLSLDLLEKTVESLEVRAPISGYLSNIDAEIGQNLQDYTPIGQIDLLDNFKLRVEIDQYYISKVAEGTQGKVTLDGKTYQVAVKKIYQEVKDVTFEADMVFVDDPPKEIKRGQPLTVHHIFSEPQKSLMVKKGGFYQETGGRWVYLISGDQKVRPSCQHPLGPTESTLYRDSGRVKRRRLDHYFRL